MPTYTFTPTSSYDLALHQVTFTQTRLKIKLTSTGQYVYNEDYSSGIAFQCSGNDFQIGTLNAEKTFLKKVDYLNADAKLWVVEASNANKFIGSNDSHDPGIYNTYNLNQCPVLISKNGTVAEMNCPCESSSGPCANGCYKYGV